MLAARLLPHALLPHVLLVGALLALPGGGMVLAETQGPGAQPAATTSSLPGGWQGRLAAMLPDAGDTASLLQWRPSLSTVQLQLQVARAGGSPEVLQQVIVSASRGVRAPYDERLGISEEQYRSYLVFQSVLSPTGKTLKLPVVRDGGHVVFGDAALLGGVLRGLSIDLKNGELRVPEGYTSRPDWVVPSASPAPEGSLDVRGGFQWKVIGNNASLGNGVRGTLTILQLGGGPSSGGQVILKYQRTSMYHFVVNTGEIILGYTPARRP